jgi:urease accessory protein
MTTHPVTRIEVTADPAGPRTELCTGALAPRRLRAEGHVVRIALVGATALLLAGDQVRVEVVVTGSVHVEIVETAGTVAYDMRGAAARWDVSVSLRDGASLSWAGEPFVVSAGAEVDRALDLDLDAGCWAVVREQIVLGRTGEVGGTLRLHSRATLAGEVLLVEDLDLSPQLRSGWATVHGRRCLVTVTSYGRRLPESPTTLQAEGQASVTRTFGDELHRLVVPQMDGVGGILRPAAASSLT